MTQTEVVDGRAAQVCQDWRAGWLDRPRARAALLILALSPSLVGPAAAEQSPDDLPLSRGRMHGAMVELLQTKVLDDSPNAPLDLDALADGRVSLSTWVRDLLAAAGPFLRNRLGPAGHESTRQALVISLR